MKKRPTLGKMIKRTMMISKIRVYLPVYASVEFQFDKPDGWDSWGEIKRRNFVLRANVEPLGGLCHQCNDHIDCEFEINVDSCKADYMEYRE